VKRKAYGRSVGLTTRMALTMFLLGLLYVVFFLVLFQLFDLGLGAVIALMAVMLGLQLFFSDRLALAAARARIVERDEAPELHDMVERLSAMADLPKPRVAVIDSDVPNAFATGRSQKRAVVAVTRGLWQRLERREVEGVVAHELAHISNRDVVTMTIASFFSMVAAMLIRFSLYSSMFSGGNRDQNQLPVWVIMFVVSIVTYVLSYILIMAISRYREYAADRGAALITGQPENLMSALQKISSDMVRIPQKDLREVAPMNAMFIVPTSWRASFGQLFATHPPLEKRIARLQEIALEMGRPVPG
jgi:heat shock protein HtpX